MSRLAVVFCFVLVAGLSYAQINPKALTLAGMSDCIKDAIGTSSVEDSSSVVIFSCSATKAKTLYNFLGRKVRAEVVQDRNGKFENRQFGDRPVTTESKIRERQAADEFRCDLIMTIGDALQRLEGRSPRLAMLCAAANTLAPRTQDAEIRKLSQQPLCASPQYGSMTRDRAREFRALCQPDPSDRILVLCFLARRLGLLRSYEQYPTPPDRGMVGIGHYRPRRFLPWRSVSGVDLEAQENTAGAAGFWGPYKRQAAIGRDFRPCAGWRSAPNPG